MALDICFDVKTFIERTCRACSRYFDFSDDANNDIRFYAIFNTFNNASSIDEESQPCEDVRQIFEELQIWKLNIRPKDGLPQQICNDCYDRFMGVKAFREECLDTQKVLESYFKDFDHLIDNASLGRYSPKADSVKSDTHSTVNPALASSLSQDGSPRLNIGSPKCNEYNDDFYAESFMGTPPPLFEEIKTDPIDMWTLECIKSEAELKLDGSPKTKMKLDDDVIYKMPAAKQNKTSHYVSDDESSTPTSDEDEEDSDDDDNASATTEIDDDIVRKRTMSTSSNYDPRNPLQCSICGAAFPKRFLLKEHRIRAHPQEKPYVCNVCTKAFKTNFLLKQHQVQHNRPDTIKCELCGKYFRSQLHLQRHTKNFHLTSTYTCHICNEKFENYTQIRFQYHVRQHGEKRFQCEFCDKSFHQKIHLINHERSHSKEQPFSCNICGKAYRQQTACQEHMLTHKDPTPFKCKICQKGFTQRSSLRMHYRTHDRNKSQQPQKLQCKLCGQNFTQQLQYEMHQLTHGSGLFVCHHCNATFKEESYLERHVKSMHSNKRKCAYCGETYPSDLALKTHLKTHIEQLNKSYHKKQALMQQDSQDEHENLYHLDSTDRCRTSQL